MLRVQGAEGRECGDCSERGIDWDKNRFFFFFFFSFWIESVFSFITIENISITYFFLFYSIPSLARSPNRSRHTNITLKIGHLKDLKMKKESCIDV